MALKYEQIAEWLRRRISDGEIPPGGKLPTGREIATEWGVAMGTVNKAIDTLRDDGLVVSRQGSGHTVIEQAVARPAGHRKRGTSRLSGAAPYRRVGLPERAVPPQPVVDALGLGPGEKALKRVRVLLLDDGSSMSLVIAWFTLAVAEACPKLAEMAPIAEGTTHYVRRCTGRSPVEAEDITRVALATEEEASLLGLERPAAVAVVLHTAFDQDHRALVCEVGVTPAHVFEETDNYPMGQQN